MDIISILILSAPGMGAI